MAKRTPLERAAIDFVQMKERRDRLKKERRTSLKKCSVGRIWCDYEDGIRKTTAELDLHDQIEGVRFDLHGTCVYQDVELCPACVKSNRLHQAYKEAARDVPRARKALVASVKEATSRKRSLKPKPSGRQEWGS